MLNRWSEIKSESKKKLIGFKTTFLSPQSNLKLKKMNLSRNNPVDRPKTNLNLKKNHRKRNNPFNDSKSNINLKKNPEVFKKKIKLIQNQLFSSFKSI